MATRKPVPGPTVPVVDLKTGLVNPVWYDFFLDQTRKRFADLPDVSTTAPTNGQVWTYNSTTKLLTPGAN